MAAALRGGCFSFSTIAYEYDACGNLTKLTYPDATFVTYSYDDVGNLLTVTDWANRTTTYEYDHMNRVKKVTKPDGSITTYNYGSKQQLQSFKSVTGVGSQLIIGYEYKYDEFARLVEEKVLANHTKLCYTYDNLDRVTGCTVKDYYNNVLNTYTFTHDAATNLTDSGFVYNENNQLTSFNGSSVSFDLDGNMVSCGSDTYTYDSLNRLTSAKGHTYTYTGEGVRLSNVTATTDIKYVYDTNAELSRLLQKTENGVVTKYVYGLGLIGEESGNTFKTYHFDLRGSTVAITDMSGNVTDTFAYDVYGSRTSRTGTTPIIFGYNGRDGVVTDANGLLYMRARYYSPDLRRFINADIIEGDISDSTSLNRYAYVNGNPVMNVDPTGYIGLLVFMGIGALIGAAFGAVGSIAEQAVESFLDGEEFKLKDIDLGKVAYEALWGAAEGAIAFSPLGPVGAKVADVAISVGKTVVDEFVDDEAGFNVTRAAQSVAWDVGTSFIPLKFLNKYADDIDISKPHKKMKKLINEAEGWATPRNKWKSNRKAKLKKGFENFLSESLPTKSRRAFLEGGFNLGLDTIEGVADHFGVRNWLVDDRII